MLVSGSRQPVIHVWEDWSSIFRRNTSACCMTTTNRRCKSVVNENMGDFITELAATGNVSPVSSRIKCHAYLSAPGMKSATGGRVSTQQRSAAGRRSANTSYRSRAAISPADAQKIGVFSAGSSVRPNVTPRQFLYSQHWLASECRKTLRPITSTKAAQTAIRQKPSQASALV